MFIIDESSIPALKSLKRSKRSYLVVNKSKLLLNAAMWFDKKDFLDYKNNSSVTLSYFVSLSPQKDFRPQSKSFEGISSRTYKRIPRP